jgi:Na+-driven multidrug efflux pump
VIDCLVIIAFGQVVNQTQAVQQGIVRGLGQLSVATFIALIAYYGFAKPLAYLYTFQISSHEVGHSLI